MSLTDQLTDILRSLGGFGPELWLSAAFCGLLLAELLLLRSDRRRARQVLAAMSVLAVGVAGVWAVLMPTRGFLFMRLLFVDNQAIYFQAVIALGAVFVLLYEMLTSPTRRTAPSLS